MGMRRETLKALEQVRDNVVTERKQSKMQTLGASNPLNNTRDKHRASKKVTSDTVDRIFANGMVSTNMRCSEPVAINVCRRCITEGGNWDQ